MSRVCHVTPRWADDPAAMVSGTVGRVVRERDGTTNAR